MITEKNTIENLNETFKSLKNSKQVFDDIEIVELEISCYTGKYYEDNFSFKVEVPIILSLFKLHSLILKVTGFDSDDHGYEFYAGHNYRNKKVRYNEREYDYGDSPFESEDPFLLEEITLHKVYPLPKSCKLYYFFDFGDHWIFEIKKSRKKVAPVIGRLYPYLKERLGIPPKQYPSFD
jgi:hypothetical protein